MHAGRWDSCRAKQHVTGALRSGQAQLMARQLSPARVPHVGLPAPLSPPAGKFPFWDNVRDCTLQQVWKSILTDKINWSAPALREVSAPAKDLLKQVRCACWV